MKRYFILAVLVLLAGCQKPPVVHDVNWYLANDAERMETLAKCNANPGQTIGSPNCLNAQTAESKKAGARRGWPTPKPIDFNKKEG